MTDNSEFAKKRFWDKYIAILESNNIQHTVQRWYVIHIENYIKYYPNQRLKNHNKENIESFLK